MSSKTQSGGAPSVHIVTLRVVRDEDDEHPSRWDWGTLIDSRYPVQVVSVYDTGEDPDESQGGK